MSQSCPSQSQPTYFHSNIITPQQKSIKIDCQQAVEKLAIKMKQVEGIEFQNCLKELSSYFKQGYAHSFIKHTTIMRKIMNHFTKLSKALEDENHSLEVQFRMIYALSILAELIRENPKVYFPFTQKFLTNIFLIDEECLVASPHRRDILAILAVLYQNLSRQIKLLQKYSMVDKLKRAVLTSYSLIDELFTLKVYNKTIMNLVQKGVIFTTAQFYKHKILDTVSHFISKSQVDMFLLRAKVAIMCFQKFAHNNNSFEGCMIAQ